MSDATQITGMGAMPHTGESRSACGRPMPSNGWSEHNCGGIYFYNDDRAHTPWGDTRPDYGRGEVRQYILDNVCMWLEEYHVDGLRFDATQFIHTVDGSSDRDLPEGWSLLQWINSQIMQQFPGRITIAEDLQNNTWLTKDVGAGGAGFGAQWDANFVRPIRQAVTTSQDAQRSLLAIRDALCSRYNDDAFDRVIYSESHDEVANGKARVPQEVSPQDPKGWDARKRSTLAAAMVFTAPGIPMLFQGQEFLEGEWFCDTVPLDWDQRDEFHGIVRLYRDLMRLWRNRDSRTRGLCGQFTRVYHVHDARKVLAYHRWDKGGPADDVVVVANFLNEPQEGYVIGFPATRHLDAPFQQRLAGVQRRLRRTSEHQRGRRTGRVRRLPLQRRAVHWSLQRADLFAMSGCASFKEKQYARNLVDTVQRACRGAGHGTSHAGRGGHAGRLEHHEDQAGPAHRAGGAGIHGSRAAGAQEMAAGIHAVLARQRDTFSSAYLCHRPTEQRRFLMYVTCLDTQNRVRAVVVQKNITELKQAEEALQHQRETLYQSEKLAAMSGLLAGMAHELNNPLAAIVLQSELLLEATADMPLAERAMDINHAAERCIRIVRNFLRLAHQTAPERTRVQLNSVITEALQLFAYALRLDNIDVSQYLADELPALWADAHQLSQVVVNLISNAQYALRATPTPRQLMLTTQFEPAHHQVVLTVADTGPGIPPEIRTHLCEPFFTTRPPGVGTGLGLSLCQGIIADHGGTFSVESQGGAGAIFRVTLPVTAAPVTTPDVTESAVPPPITGKELLVIDDEGATVKALMAVFRRDGHAVDTAANGVQALEKLRERSYDLLLCDLHMPALDGPGLYRALAQTHPHLLSRFILLTGDTLSPEAQEFLDASGAPYLAKPFRAVELQRVVRHTLQRLIEADSS